MSTDDVRETAARLLDAQVAWAVAELTGPGLAELLEHDVDDALAIAERLTLDTVVSRDSVKLVVRRAIDVAGDSALIVSVIDAVADAVYDLPAASEHTLGDVVERRHVDRLVAKLLSMHKLQDRAMDRALESPAVGQVATKFVGKIVADFVDENRKRVEKLPGAKSMMSIGLGAANRIKNATADTFLADAAGKSASYAIKRTNTATRELIREAPLHEAALELWDLQAAEPMSDLRNYLSASDVRDIAHIVRELIADSRSTPYAAELIDAVVDAVFDRFGGTDLAALLADAGLGRDDLVFALQQLAPTLLDALRDSGDLDAIIRRRLAPFFESDSALAVLDGSAAVSAPPAKAPKAAKPKPSKG